MMKKIASFYLFLMAKRSAWRDGWHAKGWITLVALLGFALGGHFVHLKLSRNFHEVVAGEVYRSAQLNGDQLSHINARYGIKSILNLRGAQPGSPWYDKEIAVSEKEGVRHIDFAMDSTKELPVSRARQLIDIMRDAPKPLLIHCDAGVNRTGLASALYLAVISDRKWRDAELQLSLIYGYLPVWLSERYAMMRSYRKIGALLGIQS